MVMVGKCTKMMKKKHSFRDFLRLKLSKKAEFLVRMEEKWLLTAKTANFSCRFFLSQMDWNGEKGWKQTSKKLQTAFYYPKLPKKIDFAFRFIEKWMIQGEKSTFFLGVFPPKLGPVWWWWENAQKWWKKNILLGIF